MARRSRRRRTVVEPPFRCGRVRFRWRAIGCVLSGPSREEGLLARAEREKERVRLLLDRYGVLFRELLQNELPAFSWGNIFRALRLMELSGEVLTGYFFEGVPGPQFISHEAFRMLQNKISGAVRLLDLRHRSGIGLRHTDGRSKRKTPTEGPGRPSRLSRHKACHGITAQRENPDLSCARKLRPSAILLWIAVPFAHKKIPTDAPHRHRNLYRYIHHRLTTASQ